MKIEFEIDDRKREMLDKLIEWYQVPSYQSLLGIMILETYADMQTDKYNGHFNKHSISR